MSDAITFRPIQETDLEFLYRVYADTREEEMNQTGWNQQQRDEFLGMQFRAQHDYYQQEFADAQYQLILAGDLPVGRLYVDRREDEVRIIDIALLTEHRGRGIGGQIMRDLLEEGADAGKPVRIHVLKENRARHLYDRLGFREIRDVGVYWLMEWTAPAPCVDT